MQFKGVRHILEQKMHVERDNTVQQPCNEMSNGPLPYPCHCQPTARKRDTIVDPSILGHKKIYIVLY